MIERSLRQVEWNSFCGEMSKLQASSVIELCRLIGDGERGANR
jgi:hypothetical protein